MKLLKFKLEFGTIYPYLTEDRIKWIYENDPKAKENDNRLLVQYWSAFDRITDLAGISEATSAETVTRAKRKLVN